MQICEQFTLQWHGWWDAWPISNLCHVNMITPMRWHGDMVSISLDNDKEVVLRNSLKDYFHMSRVKNHTSNFHFCDLFHFVWSSYDIWFGKDCVLKNMPHFGLNNKSSRESRWCMWFLKETNDLQCWPLVTFASPLKFYNLNTWQSLWYDLAKTLIPKSIQWLVLHDVSWKCHNRTTYLSMLHQC